VTEAGTSKLGDPGLHNKPLGCGASEACARALIAKKKKHKLTKKKSYTDAEQYV